MDAIPTDEEIAGMVVLWRRGEMNSRLLLMAALDEEPWVCLDCGVPKNGEDMASWQPGLEADMGGFVGAHVGSCVACAAMSGGGAAGVTD
jgi:hypothetical protein